MSRLGGSAMAKQFGLIAGMALLALSLGSGARAAVLVNDTCQDGTDSDPAAPTDTERGVDGDGDLDQASVWFQGGVSSREPVAAGGPLRGNMTAGGTSSATWTTYFTPEGTPVTLNQGDKLTVTWQ